MRHITLDTGHVRHASMGEVDARVLTECARVLASAMGSGGRVPLPAPPGYWLEAAPAYGGVAFALGGSMGPLVRCAVSAGGCADLWRSLGCEGEPPMEPWLAVRLDTIRLLLDREAIAWLGDAERCIGLAWLREAGHGVAH